MRLGNIDIDKMMAEYKNGASLNYLAKKYGVAKSTVSRYAKIYSISRTASISSIYLFDDKTFIEAISSSQSWEDISNSLGGVLVNQHFRGAVRKRCNDLNISSPVIVQRVYTNHLTKGELFSKRPNWWGAAISIRKSARQNYLLSGRPRKCAVCGYDKYVEIAHIKPVAEFDNNALVADINKIDNLVALCPTHHWEFDHGLLKL